MYAVIKAGGKQQKVKPGDVIEVELMHGGHDESVTFTPILVVDDDGKSHVGRDLGKAVVKARLVGETKGDKVKVFKYRPKTGFAKRQGHRQMYTLVEIEDVSLGKRAPSKKAPATEAEPGPEAVPEVEGPGSVEQPAEPTEQAEEPEA
jgi:large subunit ribosomal protein L21